MRKWMLRILAVFVAVVLGAAGYVLATALRSDHPVGFETVEVANPDGATFTVGIWYPADAFTWPTLTGLLVQFVAHDAPVTGKAHPLIVLSHGLAGSLSSHADTALALADAGFVVAAPLHTGDNYKDQSLVGTAKWFPVRAEEVHLALDYLLTRWRGRDRIDGDKVGVFGFSAGGGTALIALGAIPDGEAAKAHCATSDEFGCQLWKAKHAMVPDPRDLVHDPRIKAAVIIAPGAGFAFSGDTYLPREIPVQLWGGEKDESVPTPSNAEVVRRALGGAAEWHFVPNAGHFSFMVPCGPAGLVAPAIICRDPTGFDRAAFHKSFNAAVVGFLQKKLAEAPRGFCIHAINSVCIPNAFISGARIVGMGGAFDVFGHRMPYNTPPPDSSGLKAEIFIPDYITEYSRTGLDLACGKIWCVYYVKECNLPDTTCLYSLTKPILKGREERERIWTGQTVLMSARSDEAFDRFQDGASIGLHEKGGRIEYLPLRALSHTWPRAADARGAERIRVCEPCRQTPGCQRPLVDEDPNVKSLCLVRRQQR